MGDARLRTIGVVTTARSDYGILLPVLRAIEADPDLTLQLIVGGMHLAPSFGRTVDAIERDGFAIADRIELLLASDSPLGIAKSMGIGTLAFAESYARRRPDLLLAIGDRFEMHSAVVAAAPFAIPVAHLHGGEVTSGAIDDGFRHSITKLSHLHFAATEDARRRIIQLGEEPWRVQVSGAPSLDHLTALARLDAAALQARFGVSFEPAPLLVTLHPVTLQHEKTGWHIAELLAALERFDRPIVFTLPNADTSGSIIRHAIESYVAEHPRSVILDNLGTQAYFSVMACAAAMVGNSSSGIIEAASFGLPVVNIGERQLGRAHGENVLDAAHGRDAVHAAIVQALLPEFRASIAGMVNPYGSGAAAPTIAATLRSIPLDERLLMKRFYDLPVATHG